MVSAMTPHAESSADASLRMSSLALWGGLLSVGSVAVCVIATALAVMVSPEAAAVVLGLPVVSALGAGLSLLALRQIGRSGGAIVGKPIALVGLFVGLMAMILQGAMTLSALGSAWAVKTNLVPVVEGFMLAHARGDRTAMRATLGEAVSLHLDDARIDWFFDRLDSELGATRSAEFNLGVMMRATAQLQKAAASAPPGKTVIENPKPMEIVFARGTALAFVIPDDEAMRVQQRIRIADMLVMMPDSSVLTLRFDGPATALANRFGWRVMQTMHDARDDADQNR